MRIDRSGLAGFLLLLSLPILAQSPASESAAREVYNAARARFESSKSSGAAAWQLGRAAYDLADLIREDRQASALAEDGVNACRQAVALDSSSVPAHYYLGLNLGEMARARKLSALRILREMEQELLTAQQLDPAFDYAGPGRSLGMLYLEAPGWPASVGNRNKARTQLEGAVARSPDFPENRISLAEAYLRWGEVRNLEHSLRDLDELLPKARTRFPLPAWTAAWKDWDDRLAKLKIGLQKHSANPLPSPAERGAKLIK